MSGGKFGHIDRRWDAQSGAYEEMMREMGDNWPEFQVILQILVEKKRDAEELHRQVAPVLEAIENWATGDWLEDSVDAALKKLWETRKKPSS